MILSKVMKVEEDYKELGNEVKFINNVRERIGMWHPDQHYHRVWEYAMAVRALRAHFGVAATKLKVADIGCGVGFLGPLLMWLGNRVTLYDAGQVSQYIRDEMVEIKRCAPTSQEWTAIPHGLGVMNDEDRDFDAAFCISTLEHIPDYMTAFHDLLKCVKNNGLVFITTDFGEDANDHYQHAGLRAGRMFTQDTYKQLYAAARGAGFILLGSESNYDWDESCRQVYDYGFASLALVKRFEEPKWTEPKQGDE